MFVNLFILFICINVALGLVTGVEGSPLKVDIQGDCDFYPETVYGQDVNDIDGDGDTTEVIRLSGAPDIDPVIGESGGSEDISDLTGEMITPTNSTDTDPNWLGDGNPFNALTDPATRGWKAMETMLNVVSGGYIFDIVENTTLHCELDNRTHLNTAEECLALPTPAVAPCVNPWFGQLISPKKVTNEQDECNEQHGFTDPPTNSIPTDAAPCFVDQKNEMWIQFKTGVYVVFSMLMIITVFYWLTGRGHILSG